MAALAKVLLVDDEREFVAILARRLTHRNCLVTFAHKGKDALAKLVEDSDIEVVILDVNMPDIDGIETLKLIKEKWPLVEVIMLTGHSTIAAAVHAIKLGAYDYIVKPVEIEELVSKIDKAARRKRNRDQLILEVYMKPYLTPREREEQIAKIIASKT
jgi:DNA-binding NtrC family response regulator